MNHTEKKTLQDLKPLESAEVESFAGSPDMIARLRELGIRQGLQVSLIGQAPFWGPKLFRAGLTVLALRQEEASCVFIQSLKTDRRRN
ncbi:MAG: ferrous iron transport protein A [Bdellovibrio sp.]|nr:MAG: ferrous iron transport protein A [Bdellovibrio sp.]